MRDLVSYMVEPLLHHRDEMALDVEEGDASIIFELRVHPADAARLRADDGRLLKAVQKVLAASSGTRKPVLDLVDDADSDEADTGAADDDGSTDDDASEDD